MYTILLSIPRSSRHSNPNEVNWESVHSHFSDLFSEDFICAVKPFNGDHTLAKVFFKKRVTFAGRSDDFLINNAVPAKVIERKEETDLPEISSTTVDLGGQFTEDQLIDIRIELEEQYGIRLQCSEEAGATTTCSLHACHPDVLACAKTALRKWAVAHVGQQAGVSASVASSSNDRQLSRRRPLFPAAFAGNEMGGAVAIGNQASAAAPSRPLNAPDIGPYDFELQLNDACVLRVQPHDITALQCDLMVVTTSCSLSLSYGLARIVASRAGSQALNQLCRQHVSSAGNLKFGESHLVAAPPGSQLPARYILFLALPNDQRLVDTVDAAQFKAVMRDVVDRLLARLVELSESSATGVRTVAMTVLGANLPYWSDRSEDFAHVLVAALWHTRDSTGRLRRLDVCDLQLETLATLGRVLSARFSGIGPNRASGGAAAAAAPPRRGDPEESLPRPAANAPPQLVGVGESGVGECDICCSELTPANPRVRFHCDRGSLCAACVRRLQDPAAPGNGKCPLCQDRYRPAIGNQPAGGSMTVLTESFSLPGHEGHATMVVTYTFGPGLQGPEHPNPGQPYRGASRVTYFPDTPEGREVVTRLKAAFKGRSVFTVGTSATTGMENTLTWATVHHKTNTGGGPERHGYPDPTYLSRIKDELRSLGY